MRSSKEFYLHSYHTRCVAQVASDTASEVSLADRSAADHVTKCVTQHLLRNTSFCSCEATVIQRNRMGSFAGGGCGTNSTFLANTYGMSRVQTT